MMAPTVPDLWLMSHLAHFLGKHPLFDLAIQSTIHEGLLGGFCFGAALFALAIRSRRTDFQKERLRLSTTILGSIFAILLTLMAASFVHWPPPNRYPQLSQLYPGYIERNHNLSSFPSQSTAVCAATAAGVASLWLLPGALLWLAVAILVALPRVYVGGHYPADVLVGVACGIFGYALARACEPAIVTWLRALGRDRRIRAVGVFFLFIWILEITSDFRGSRWLGSAVVRYASSNPVRIGGDSFFGQHFEGRIDEVRIYKRALSAQEILQDMRTPVDDNQQVQPSGIVAAYSFDEGSGTTVRDLAGNGNEGKIFNATWTAGKFGQALFFNGLDSWVTIRNSASLDLTSAMTLEAWVYPTVAHVGWQDVIFKETDIYYLSANSRANSPAGGGTFTESGTQSVFGPAPLVLDTWTHLALTFDGGSMRLYENGVEVARRAQSGTLTQSSKEYFLK